MDARARRMPIRASRPCTTVIAMATASAHAAKNPNAGTIATANSATLREAAYRAAVRSASASARRTARTAKNMLMKALSSVMPTRATYQGSMRPILGAGGMRGASGAPSAPSARCAAYPGRMSGTNPRRRHSRRSTVGAGSSSWSWIIVDRASRSGCSSPSRGAGRHPRTARAPIRLRHRMPRLELPVPATAETTAADRGAAAAAERRHRRGR